MGYIERLLGENERVLYQTHQHAVVLLQNVLSSLFALIVFGTAAVLLLLFGDRWIELGNRPVQWASLIGLIALGTVIVPLAMVVAGLLRRREGQSVVSRIWRPALVGLLILAFALLALIRPEWRFLGFVPLLLSLVLLVQFVHGLIVWQSERYIITNRRVIRTEGIINKLTRDSALEKVNDLELKQSVVGRLLGYGTVKVITGSDTGVDTFRRISHPGRFKRALLNAKEELHVRPLDELPDVTQPAPAPSPGRQTPPMGQVSPAASVADRLAELSDLHARGLISDAEFQAKRQELLNLL